MEDRVCVKAYLRVGSDKPTEVRRFYISQNGSSSYAALKEKLANLFPQLEGQEIIITWQDREGDEVRINSDEEFLDGLIETKQVLGSDIFKISVRSDRSSTPGLGQTPSLKTDGDVHPNVECDGCNKMVKGFRYKCLQCSDYDLCAKCEAAGTHAKHNMIRLVQPVVIGHPWRQYMRRCHRWFPVYENGEWSSPDQKREKKRDKYKRTCDDATKEAKGSPTEDSSSDRDESPRCGKKAKQQQKNSEKRAHVPPPFPQFSEIMNGFWTGLSGACPPPPPPPPPMPFPGNVEMLHNIGQHFKTMLDPLGVDVHVDVEHNGKRTCFKNKMNCGKKETDQEKKEEKKMETEEQTSEKENQEKKEETQSEGCETVVNGVAAMQIDDADKTSEGETIKDFVVLSHMEAPKTSATDKGDWQMRPQIPPELQQDITPVLSKEASPEAIQTEEPKVTEAAVSTMPSAPQEPVVTHPDPKVAKSLAQMLAMGFTNEGGWLTQLLEIKGGDISQALDVLGPVFPKSSK